MKIIIVINRNYRPAAEKLQSGVTDDIGTKVGRQLRYGLQPFFRTMSASNIDFSRSSTRQQTRYHQIVNAHLCSLRRYTILYYSECVTSRYPTYKDHRRGFHPSFSAAAHYPATCTTNITTRSDRTVAHQTDTQITPLSSHRIQRAHIIQVISGALLHCGISTVPHAWRSSVSIVSKQRSRGLS